MSLHERLLDFAGAIASATSGPEGYPPNLPLTYESNMADIKALWSEIRPRLKHDLERIPFIDETLHRMFTAFEGGNVDSGCAAAWALYNLPVRNLR